MSSNNTTEVRLIAENLWKYYDDRAVVQGVSFALEPGEILGLLGRNGAGKTTIVGMLYGSVLRSKGSARFEPGGVPSESSEARRHLGIVTQENNLDPDFNLRDNLILFAHHYQIVGKEAEQRADQLIELLHLTEHRSHRIENLSGGLQRRLVLARALIPNPQVIFLDEPTTGFDPDVRQEFWRFILQLRDQGKSILLTSHYMDEAERLCDRLLLLQDGLKIDEGTPRELVSRIIGDEVIEVSGLEETTIRSILQNDSATILPFGTTFLLPSAQLNTTAYALLQEASPDQLRRRSANLEDVFLALTGTQHLAGKA